MAVRTWPRKVSSTGSVVRAWAMRVRTAAWRRIICRALAMCCVSNQPSSKSPLRTMPRTPSTGTRAVRPCCQPWTPTITLSPPATTETPSGPWPWRNRPYPSPPTAIAPRPLHRESGLQISPPPRATKYPAPAMTRPRQRCCMRCSQKVNSFCCSPGDSVRSTCLGRVECLPNDACQRGSPTYSDILLA